jgi:hypothetical protein
MGTWTNRTVAPPVTYHIWSPESCGIGQTALPENFTNMSSLAWSVANTAVYIPFSVTTTITVTKLWVKNGTVGVSSDTYQLGIYSSDGTRLVTTGDINQNDAIDGQLEITDITDTILYPGEYYLAMAASGTGIVVQGTAFTNVGIGKTMGFLMQTGLTGSTLPATATFATYNDSNGVNPFIGFLVGPRTAL